MSTKAELLKLALEVEAVEKTARPANYTISGSAVPVDLILGNVTRALNKGDSWRIEVDAEIDAVHMWSGVIQVMKTRTGGFSIVPTSPGPFPTPFLRILEKNLTPKIWDLMFGSY